MTSVYYLSDNIISILTLVGYTKTFRKSPAIPYPNVCDEKMRKIHTAAFGVLVYQSRCTAMISAAIADRAAVEDIMRMAACSLWLKE